MNEADTCRKSVVPALTAAGWDAEPCSIAEQHIFTDGRIIASGGKHRREERKRCDYLLKLRPDFGIAVVEAKASSRNASDGIQQAMDYATCLDLKFAYSTNGQEIVEHDFITGRERKIRRYPSPEELWQRLSAHLGVGVEGKAQKFLTPYHHDPTRRPRYYQDIAIHRTVAAVLRGDSRILLTLATGTGKTEVAFQICWKLWSSRWNREGAHRRPKILYLADRSVLVDDPKDKTFAPFGDARAKIESGEIQYGRDIYFATYQAIAEDESRTGRFRDYPEDFFDLVIVDECHRGSAREESAWRSILQYFAPAVQLGMTATPLRDDTRDTYLYFGNPVYRYSLKDGIQDGFLAPYRLHRVVSDLDAAGWRPQKGQRDRYFREIPDRLYGAPDFDRVVVLQPRTEAIARHLTGLMKQRDRFGKTIVFCVDQEHAAAMRTALSNLNADLVARFPDYVCRVTAEEGDIGRMHLSKFQDVESITPAILTTSQLLTTGVDAPTCKNVVIARMVGSMTEFKQMIGRGTRVRDDYDKYSFDIIDYTGAASEKFADPDFDGMPAEIIDTPIDQLPGDPNAEPEAGSAQPLPPGTSPPSGSTVAPPEPSQAPRKFYVDEGRVKIATHLIYDLDPSGKRLEIIELTDFTAQAVRTLHPDPEGMRNCWINSARRTELVEQLDERGIDLGMLAEEMRQPDADSLDLLCHVAYGTPLRTRRERADRVRHEHAAFLKRYRPEAREVLELLLQRYAEHGADQLVLPDAVKLPPICRHGNSQEIGRLFGGAEKLRQAVDELQSLLWAA